MPRTITIDSVQTVQLQLAKGPAGDLQVSAEFHLKSGDRVIKVEYQNITDRMSNDRRNAALAAFEAIAQELAAAELA